MKKKKPKISKRVFFFLISFIFLLNSFNLFAMDKPIEEEILVKKVVGKDKPRRKSRSFSLGLGNSRMTIEKSSDENQDGVKRSSSSSLSPLSDDTTQENDSDTQLSSPVTMTNETEKTYLDAVVYYLKKSKSVIKVAKDPTKEAAKVGKALVYTSLLFIPEIKFFHLLTKFKPKYSFIITAFLEQLALAGFPNGIKNLQTAAAEFNELKKDLRCSPLLSMCLSHNFTPTDLMKDTTQQISDLICKHQQNGEGNVSEIKIGDYLSDAILARDIYLFQHLVPQDIKNYLNNSRNIPESMTLLGSHFDRTANWIALQIVSTPETIARQKLFKTFSLMGKSALKRNNFHLAMQISVAFSKPAVQRLISDEVSKDPNLKEIVKLLKHKNNYRNYREYLSKATEKGDSLPFFPILAKDLVLAYATYDSAKDPHARSSTFEALANLLEVILRSQALPYPTINTDYVKFVCGFKEVHPETLDVFSDICIKSKILKDVDTTPPEALESWTPWYFASFLRNNGCEHQVLPIFKLGLYGGEEMINYMGTGDREDKKKNLERLGINEKIINDILAAYSEQFSLNQILVETARPNS